MNETAHLKCPCQQCGGSIEFPAHGVDSAIPCPHCGQTTILLAPEASPMELTEEPAPAPRPGAKGRLVPAALILIFATGISLIWMARRNTASQSDDFGRGTAPTNASTISRPGDADGGSQPSTVKPGKTSKSLDDLKVGVITLEKTKGSSLVHAIGILKNASDHQRFGVSIELELSDVRGNKAGMARDYRAVIEPRQEWRFRALVLDSKAVSAQVKSIREEE